MQGRRSDNSTPQLASIQMARLVCMSISTTVIHGESYIRRSHALQRERECPTSWIIGMYGPPPRRKRNLRTPQVGLRKCIRPLLEWITPGQDGMRCALFSINWSVAKDYFRFRIWRAPGSTVVPSPHSPADLAGNHDLAVVARLQPHRPILGADMVHSWRVRPRRFERVC